MPKNRLGDKPPKTEYISHRKPLKLKTKRSGLNRCPQCPNLKRRCAKLCKHCRLDLYRSPIDPRTYSIEGVKCRRVPLTHGLYATVNATDYRWVMKYEWHSHWQGKPPRVYAVGWDKEKRRHIRMHRLLLGLDNKRYQGDHRNGNGIDNRRKNLRKCNQTQNAQNRRINRNNTSGYIGVHFHKGRGKWNASIVANGRQISLGYFDKPKDAAHARDKAAIKYRGKFAILNFPKSNV